MSTELATTKQKQAAQFFLFLAGIGIVWSIRATYLYTFDASIASDEMRLLYSTLVKFLLWVVPAFAFARWVRQTAAFTYLGFTTWPSLSQWGLYLAVMALFFSTLLSIEIIRSSQTLSLADLSASFTFTGLLFHIISPLIEEILFRSLIMKEFLHLLSPFRANVVTSLLFVGIHLPFWLWHDGVTPALLLNSVGIFIFSLLAGWLYHRSASLWPPTVAHILNNYMGVILVMAVVR